MQIYKQILGNILAIGIEGGIIEIERTYYNFYNHQGTDGELHWMSDNFGYFWTNNEDLTRGMINIALNRLCHQASEINGNLFILPFLGKKGGFIESARILAARELNKIPSQSFLPKDVEINNDPFILGYLEFYDEEFDIFKPKTGEIRGLAYMH
jgi:hypothetical protein